VKRKLNKKNLNKDFNKQKGFTLIELLLVVALLAISVGVTNDILISLIRTNNKTQVMNEIEQQSNFLSLKMEKELRNARTVTTPSEDGSGDTLLFTTRDGNTIQYELISGIIYRTFNSGGAVAATSNASPGGVVAECPEGCFTTNGSNPQVVNININFSQAQQGVGNSYTGKIGIKSTIVIRNTY
jgi:prepilin-type N-terminal cleavage/methylation domain-containing protein